MGRIGGKDRWEIRVLEEIIREIYGGCDFNSTHLGTGNHPAIINSISRLPRKLCECIHFVDPNLIKNKKYCEHGDIVISKSGWPNLGRNCVYLGKEKCIVRNGVFVIKHNEDPNFLSWALTSNDCKKQMRERVKSVTTTANLKTSDITKVRIPIAPKNQQKEIADKLDTWETIELELERELESRKKQFRYYRDSLLWNEFQDSPKN